MSEETLNENIKQKLILDLLGYNQKPTVNKSQNVIDNQYIGRKVLIRTYSAGVHFGELVQKSRQQVILKDSRRIYSWVKACSLSQLAMEGSKDIDSCKIAVPVNEIILDRVIETIPMTEVAIENLYGAKHWKS